MKRLALLLTLLIPVLLTSQPCLPDGITINSQAEIDSFQVNNPNCTEIEGFLRIKGNDITNLNGLNVITSIGGSLGIYYNPNLTSLTGLDNVTSLTGGDNSIDHNDSLINLSGLDNVTTVDGYLRIYGNPSLTSLTGLENVTSIGGSFMLSNNDALQNLEGLNNLEYIEGYITISSHDNLSSVEGLNNLSSVEGYIDFVNNNSLTDLTALSNITSIDGGIMFEFNNSLTRLTGLENITSIGGGITVEYNNSLISLNGLENINSSTIEFLRIMHNESLTTCEIESICNFILNAGEPIYINYNASGCNSQEEVEEACETVSVEEIALLDEIISFPNPFSTSTSIEYKLNQPVTVRITFYNSFGRVVDI